MEFKILIIDRDQSDLDSIKKVFNYEGYGITVTMIRMKAVTYWKRQARTW